MTLSILRKTTLLGAIGSLACLAPSALAQDGVGGTGSQTKAGHQAIPQQEGTADGLWTTPALTEGELRGVFRDEGSSQLYEIEALVTGALPVDLTVVPTAEPAPFGFLYGEVYKPAAGMAPREFLGTFEGQWQDTGNGSGHFFALLYHARLYPSGQAAGVFEGDFRTVEQVDVAAATFGDRRVGGQTAADVVTPGYRPTPPPVQVPTRIQSAGSMSGYGLAPEGQGIDPAPWQEVPQLSAIQGAGAMGAAGGMSALPDGSVHLPGPGPTGPMTDAGGGLSALPDGVQHRSIASPAKAAGAGSSSALPGGLVHQPTASGTGPMIQGGGMSSLPGGLVHQPTTGGAGAMDQAGGMSAIPGGLIHLPSDGDGPLKAGGQTGVGVTDSSSAGSKGQFQGRWMLFQ